ASGGRRVNRAVSETLPLPAKPGGPPLPWRARRALIATHSAAQFARAADAFWTARLGHTARASTQLCYSSSGRGRRSQNHSGIVGPRIAVDNATVHRGRCRPTLIRLSPCPSTRAQNPLLSPS